MIPYEAIHPITGWVLLALPTMIHTFIIWAWVVTDVGFTTAKVRRSPNEQRWQAYYDGVIRYLTIPYLITLPSALIVLLIVGESPPSTWDWLSALVHIWLAKHLWREYKNRNRKHKVKEKVLAKVEELQGKLVVVPVGT